MVVDSPDRPTLRAVLQTAVDQLTAAGCDTPRLDAEVLLTHLLQRERSWLYANFAEPFPLDRKPGWEALLSRRVNREPVAYLTGHREFYGLDFIVTPAVLIPRPETEHLIEYVVNWATARTTLRIADIGTGSGCIAVTLATVLPNAELWAVDTSPAALEIARQNAMQHGVAERITFVEGDLMTPLAGPWDIVVSNPPYVTHDEWAAARPEVRAFEPRLALTAGDDGLDLIRRLLKQAKKQLKPNGLLLFEIGAGQGAQAEKLAQTHFPAGAVTIQQDLAGLDRFIGVSPHQGHC